MPHILIYLSTFACTVSLNWDQSPISFVILYIHYGLILNTISSVKASQNSEDQGDLSLTLYTV